MSFGASIQSGLSVAVLSYATLLGRRNPSLTSRAIFNRANDVVRDRANDIIETR